MGAAPGQWVTETIELIAPIAQGAMGKVWVAYHHGLHTRVAVKFVADSIREDGDEAVKRFQLEARTASQIKSPHVVQTFDSGVSRFGAPYIVMELLEGETLQDRVRQQGPMSVPEATKVLTQVGRALSAAHEQGIIHRDIKPANIFLTRSEGSIFCKVLDFGLAKQTRLPAMGGLTTDGKLVGTPEYMSPEQVLENHDVDYRADLWALGVVIYVTLTGHMPFTGRTLGQLCLNLVNKRPKPPSVRRPELPAHVDGWMSKALNRDPDQRFTSARDMMAGFASEAFVSLDRVDSLTESNLGSVVPAAEPKRSWTTAVAGFTVAASVLLSVGAATFLTSSSTATRAQPAWSVRAVSMAEAAQDQRRAERTRAASDSLDAEAAAAEADDEEQPVPMPKRSGVSSRPTPPPPPAPKSASTPEASSGSKKRRGKSDLGF